MFVDIQHQPNQPILNRTMTTTSDSSRARRRRTASAFTLIEVMIVLFILLSLTGIGVISFRSSQERARRQEAQAYVRVLDQAVDMYQLHVGRFPTTEQGLNSLLNPPADLSDPNKWDGPYLKDNAKTLDPWDNPYEYAFPGTNNRNGCDIWSWGPDGISGTEDDIGNWTNVQ